MGIFPGQAIVWAISNQNTGYTEKRAIEDTRSSWLGRPPMCLADPHAGFAGDARSSRRAPLFPLPALFPLFSRPRRGGEGAAPHAELRQWAWMARRTPFLSSLGGQDLVVSGQFIGKWLLPTGLAARAAPQHSFLGSCVGLVRP